MRITIVYKVPISVIVDVAARRVERVLIHDEEVDSDPSDVLTYDGESILETELARDAALAAGNASSWPAWEFV